MELSTHTHGNACVLKLQESQFLLLGCEARTHAKRMSLLTHSLQLNSQVVLLLAEGGRLFLQLFHTVHQFLRLRHGFPQLLFLFFHLLFLAGHIQQRFHLKGRESSPEVEQQDRSFLVIITSASTAQESWVHLPTRSNLFMHKR